MAVNVNFVALLIEARRLLRVSQGELGVLLGSSRRTGQRWEGSGSSPSHRQLGELARRIHPLNRELAAQIAEAGKSSLEDLGLERPPAPPPPPPAVVSPPAPPALPDEVVDAVVCAAAEAIDVTPRSIRPALVAAFTCARRIGLTVEAVEKALLAGRPRAKAGGTREKG